MTNNEFKKKLILIIVSALTLSLIVQCSIYLYLDKVRYKEEDTFKIEKIEETKKEEKKIDIPIPVNAKNIEMSHNNKYMSYFIDNEFRITNTLTNETVFSEDKKGTCFYKWVLDSDRLFIAEKNNKYNRIEFFTYDVKNNKRNEVTNSETHEPIYIELNNSESKIKDIKMSTLTNTIYVDVEDNRERDTVYRIDINVNLDRITLKTNNIGKINVLNRNDVLLYENLSNGILSIQILNLQEYDGSRKINIRKFQNPTLLYVDSEDNIYIGEKEGNSITKIFVTSKDIEENTGKYIDLTEPINYKNLIITSDGKIYFNDTSNNVLKEQITKSEIKYKGHIIKIDKKQLVTNYNKTLLKENINDISKEKEN